MYASMYLYTCIFNICTCSYNRITQTWMFIAQQYVNVDALLHASVEVSLQLAALQLPYYYAF